MLLKIIRPFVTPITEHSSPASYSQLDIRRISWETTMSTATNHTTEASPGTYLVQLFKLDADQFQLLAQKPRYHRDCEYLNRPYELSDLMRQATDAGVWPR